MISLSEIVLRLRANVPALQMTIPNPNAGQPGQPATVIRGKVGGAADFGDAFDTLGADLPVPHAFVIPLYAQDMSPPDMLDTERQQRVRQYFATVVCIDNRKEGGAGGAAGRGDLEELDTLAIIQEQLERAFAGWRPVQRFGPVRYSQDRFLEMNNARLWHQFEWWTEYDITPTTGPDEDEEEAAIIEGMDTIPPWQGSIGQTIRDIYVKGRENNSLVHTPINYPEWLDDFFGRAFAPAPLPEEEVAERAEEYTLHFPVTDTDKPDSDYEVRDRLIENGHFQEPPLPEEEPDGDNGIFGTETPKTYLDREQ